MPVRPRAARAAAFALAALATLGACRSTFEPDVPRGACRQTYEFGNYGCSRLVVLVDASGVLPPPAAYRLHVAAFAVPGVMYEPFLGMGEPNSGVLNAPLDLPRQLEVTYWGPVPPGDTVPAWVVARLLDSTNPVVNTPLPTVAADSVRYTFRRTPVGAVPRVDTVRLTLRRP